MNIRQSLALTAAAAAITAAGASTAVASVAYHSDEAGRASVVQAGRAAVTPDGRANLGRA